MSFNDFGLCQPVKKDKKQMIDNISDDYAKIRRKRSRRGSTIHFLMSPKTVASLFEKDRAENEFDIIFDTYQ